MAIRTSGVGASRKLEIWDQYGVKKYDFSPTQMLTPGPVLFELEHLVLTDTDVTPVGNVLLKVLDQVPYFRNEADTADIILPEEDIPHHLADAVELDSLLTLNAGAIMAAFPAAPLDINGNWISNAPRLLGNAGEAMFVFPGDSLYYLELVGGLDYGEGGSVSLYSTGDLTYPDSVLLASPNAAHTDRIVRLRMYGAAAEVDAEWAGCIHKGLKLGADLDANGFAILGLAATSFGDDVALGFGATPDALFAWDTTDPNAMMMKLDLPVGGVVDVPAFLVGIGIRAVDLAMLDGISEPVMGVVDADRDARATLGFSADDQPELNFNAISKLLWDVTDPNANLLKVDLPTGGLVNVPVMALGIAIADVDLGFFDGLTEPVAALVDIAQTSWVTFGFGAAATPELNCGGVATAIRLGVPFDMNANKIGGLDAPVAQDDALRKQRAEIIETDVDVTEIEVLSHKDAASGYCPLDAGSLVPLANIPTPLTGKDADTVDTIEGADIILRDGTVAFTGPVPTGAAGALTIDGVGAITVTKSFHKVDTNAGGPTDDLDNIAGGGEGDILVLKATDGTHTVVCKHATGNLRLDGSADFSLDNADDTITLIFDGTNWLEQARSNNGA